MIDFELSRFHHAVTIIQHMQTSIAGKKSAKAEPDGGLTITPISDKVYLHEVEKRANELIDLLRDLHAAITIKAVEDVLRGLASLPTYESLNRGFIDIQVTLDRELESRKCLVLSEDDQRLYEPRTPLFGQDFQNRFRTRGAYELDEAAKCMALGRPTAAVFHMMRILEVLIQSLSRCLGIPDPTKPAERNWAIILGLVKNGVVAKWPTAADRMHGDGQLLEAIHATLDAVKNPWRNATMHVDQKYTDTEAEDVFAGVRGFARRLAARMDENGDPKA